ncbi:hypothetical protein ABOM_006236 [Aspergillus bombycis]|uniref:Pre-mRNA splicing factor n=1 Tax=Aspergillus bombycis TaxID=109264 RepID=A0A1F8A2K5_9EURO|nr:hypothetical protein ABOM_006236 [Aspergillus bombycis]OGM45585.1 hypothetical protein ABOM_006236 [Aspergillus bombycis]
MNNIIKRIVSLFSVKEPQRDVPPAEHNETPDQSPTMVRPKPVSVVVSPPAFDLDSYEPFDEDYFQRTVDEILSDEASFENSFDEYHGAKMMDGTCDWGTSMAGDSGPGSSGSKVSSYFPSKLARKRPVAHRVIRKIESTDDEDNSEESEEILISEEAERVHDGQSGGKVIKRADPADSVAKIKLEELEKRGLGDEGVRAPKEEAESAAQASSVIGVDACDDEDLQEVSEERFVFASVSEEEHDRLVEFLLDHPFMREGAYPVRRSARRRFVNDVRREASISGMDGSALGVLIKWIKKTYLEVCMVPDADKEGSEFGDEIDDEKTAEHRSQRELKKERKRKRTSIDQARGETKTKKTKRSDIPMIPSKHDVREAINIDSDDSAIAISKSTSANTQVLEKNPAPQTDLQRAPTSHRVNHGDVQVGREIIEHVTPLTPTTPSIQKKRNEQSISHKKPSPPMPRHYNSTPNNDVKSNEGNLRVSQERILRNDSPKKPTVSSDTDLPSSYSKNPKSPSNLLNIAESRRKKKKREKNKKRRQLRKERIRSETMSEISQLSRKGDQHATATRMGGTVPQEHSAESTSSLHKAVAMDDPFWDMDF